MHLFVNIKKNIAGFNLDINFECSTNKIAILGASGSGKSLLLRCISGLETPDSGTIIYDGEIWFDAEMKINIPPKDRKIGFMFQNNGLFPNMTVRQNLEFICSDQPQIDKILEKFEIDKVQNKNVKKISGGEMQRTALARMLVSNPNLILMDEPLSALDTELKETIKELLRDIMQKSDNLSILVTHDKNEAYYLCDKILVVDNGKVDSFNEKDRLFKAPNTLVSAKTFGCKNIFKSEQISHNMCYLPDLNQKFQNISSKYIGVFDYNVEISKKNPQSNSFEGKIIDIALNPFDMQIKVELLSTKSIIWAKILRQNEYLIGDNVYVSFKNMFEIN